MLRGKPGCGRPFETLMRGTSCVSRWATAWWKAPVVEVWTRRWQVGVGEPHRECDFFVTLAGRIGSGCAIVLESGELGMETVDELRGLIGSVERMEERRRT